MPSLTSKATQASVTRAVFFLRAHQRIDGYIPSHIALERDFSVICLPDYSLYPALWTAHCMSFCDHPEAGHIRAAALAFVENYIEGPGLWRYWIPAQKTAIPPHLASNTLLVPDLDDTACASALLKHSNPLVRSGRNVPVILRCRDERGVFDSWIRPESPGIVRLKAWLKTQLKARLKKERAPEIDAQATVVWQGDLMVKYPVRREFDSVVNANVLWYLGERPETKKAGQWLREIVYSNAEMETTEYYEDALTLHYSIARAAASGVPMMQALGPEIARKISARGEAGGMFGNEANAALALSTLLSFQAGEESLLRQCAEHLLATQRDDGSWPALPLWHGNLNPPPANGNGWFGSAELTTALCIESLARFQKRASL